MGCVNVANQSFCISSNLQSSPVKSEPYYVKGRAIIRADVRSLHLLDFGLKANAGILGIVWAIGSGGEHHVLGRKDSIFLGDDD